MDKKIITGELLAVARELISTDFPTRNALEKYLKEHPDADRSNHRVVEKSPAKKDKQKGGLIEPVYNEFKSLEKMDTKTKQGHVDKMIESKGIDQAKRHFKTLYKHLNESGAGMEDVAVIQEALNHIENREDEQKSGKTAQDLENVKTLSKFTDRELARAIRDAVVAEEQAINQYETIVDAAGNEKAKTVLQDIADEEKVHVFELQALLDMLLEDEGEFRQKGKKEVKDLER